MTWKYFLSLLLFTLFFIIAPVSYFTYTDPTPTIKVIEDKAVFSFAGEEAIVTLPIESSATLQTPTLVYIELVDPEDKVIASNSSYENLSTGLKQVTLNLSPSIDKETKGSASFFWYRLRYVVTTTLEDNKIFYQGVLSLSNVWKTAFELNIVANDYTVEGSRCPVRVLALHPISKRPVSGVNIEAKIEIDQEDKDEDLIIKASAKTNLEGHALLQFDLPKQINDSYLDLEISGELNGCSQTLSDSINLNNSAFIIVNTDKPIYQPGQTLHIRLLSFDSIKRAIANEPLSLEISDPENTKVFNIELKTSRFGIASADWSIPANIRLGDYRIKANLDGEKHSARTYFEVKISRYDLPTFTVSAKTERPYYLAEQTHAQVEVSADYLFGKPVKSGNVKISHQSDRRWNYRNQKYESTEQTLFEGQLNSSGKAIVNINFSEIPNLSNLDCTSSRYEDIDLAAYVTDSSTNRTEQKRFSLRLSQNDIHIYVINYKTKLDNFPKEFYLSASYADGSPALCNISMYHQTKGSENPCQVDGKPILTVQTNRYGVAKVSNFMATNDIREPFIFSATDKSKHLGLLKYEFPSSPESYLNIATDKSVYRHGESIKVNISSNQTDMSLIVDIGQADKVLESRSIRLENGQASFTVPYNKDFKGAIKILSYAPDIQIKNYSSDFFGDIQTIFYPVNESLNLGIKLNKQTYKPGEEVNALFKVKNSFGKPIESALGVVVFDKAVEARFQTEQEFNSNPSYYQTYNSLSGYSSNNIGGITLKELNRLALSEEISADLQLVAEVLLNEGSVRLNFNNETADKFSFDYQKLFIPTIKATLRPIEEMLNSQYLRLSSYPKNEDSFHSLLEYQNSYFNELRDPWGMAYKAVFSTRKNLDLVEIVSLGADKQFGTSDDFVALEMGWPYFRPYGEILNKVVNSYFDRTGICIKDLETLKQEALKYGIKLDLLVDPAGQPYQFRFEVLGRVNNLYIYGNDPSKPLNINYYQTTVWTIRLDYVSRTRLLIQKALDKYLQQNPFPQNKIEFDRAMQQSNIDFSSLKDFWGSSYEVAFDTSHIYDTKTKTSIIKLVSRGYDRFAQTNDDFAVATFFHNSQLANVELQSFYNAKNLAKLNDIISSSQLGGVKVTAFDITGAVIAGANIRLTNNITGASYSSSTNEDGQCLINQLYPGFYSVEVSAEGFRKAVSEEVRISLLETTSLNITLEAGETSEIVTVSGGEETVEYTSSQISTNVDSLPINKRNFLNFALTSAQANQISTPRLREDFPETLFWQPEIETTSDGQATVKFKLADNITTWKMTVVGSTVDGEITTVDSEFQAFQPFFVELDPPKSLTEGDEIALPIVLRNYLQKPQTVTMDIASQPWLTTLSPLKRKVTVLPGDFSKEIFNFRADTPISKGNQLVSVVGKEASDAIKKPVDVFPYGQEISEPTTKILDNKVTTFDINLPANALRNNQSVELRLYPNLLSHVLESIEGILKRPYGCGEQTISSTYPSLLMLKYLKQNNLNMPVLEEKAKKYLQIGYERLLGYRGANGGFTYWGKGEENAALTVYALRFLTDAKEFLDIDNNVVNGASNWVLSRQLNDGSWANTYYNQTYKEGSLQLTAFISMVLARTNNNQNEVMAKKLKLAMDYLERETATNNDPYTLACYGQAAIKLGYTSQANLTLNKLSKLASIKSGASYWELNGYTPFYGWGLTGTIETTALAVQALAQITNLDKEQNTSQNNLVNQGLIYLLSNKDSYGVWYSTQTTVNVIDAILAVLAQNSDLGQNSKAQTEVYVNGQLVKSLALFTGNQPNEQIIIDLTKFITKSNAQIEIRNGQGSAQIIHNYYLPWSEDNSSATNSKLALSVNFDKTEAAIGEEITCQVIAKRLYSSRYGYGMMLAEIGLPPGADIDRASLEKAIEETGGAINQYDILPDRLVLYLWSYLGETKFSFKFRERFGIKAMSCRSVIYDYYNPEAKVTLAPKKFIVLGKEE